MSGKYYYVKQEHIDAIRAAGITPETIAYSIGGNTTDVEQFFEGVDEAAEETERGLPDAFYRYATGIFTEDKALLLTEKLTNLGEMLSPGDGRYVPGLIQRLQEVSLLTIGQISDLTGISVELLSGYMRNPESVPCNDRHHIAAEVQRLDTVLNYIPVTKFSEKNN